MLNEFRAHVMCAVDRLRASARSWCSAKRICVCIRVCPHKCELYQVVANLIVHSNGALGNRSATVAARVRLGAIARQMYARSALMWIYMLSGVCVSHLVNIPVLVLYTIHIDVV